MSDEVVKNPFGHPAVWTDPVEMWSAGKAYARECREKKIPLTLTGLALELGFASRQSLYDYAQKKEFKQVIDELKLECERYYEERLTNGGNPVGAIFALKNFGWNDKQQVDVNSTLSLSLAQAIEAGRRNVIEDK